VSNSNQPSGIVGIIAATLSASVGITLVTGDVFHWPLVAAGLAMGLWVVRIINE